jgi:hypothetical protein
MATTFVSGRFFDYRAVGLTPGAALYTYAAGTLTPQATYADQGGGSSNANPVICDVNGGADVWLGTSSYKFRLYTDTTGNGGTLIDEWDNISSPALAADLANETDATLGSGLVGFAPEGTGAVGRTVFSILRERKRLTDRLSTTEIDDILSGTASIDIAAKFNVALADAAGKLLILPWGTINMGAALTAMASKTWIEGQGSGTQLLCSSTTADIFTLGDSATEISSLVFSDFDIWSSVVKTAGYAFNARLTTDSLWRNVNVGSSDLYTAATAHRLFRGWYFDRFDTVEVDGGWCVTSDDGLRARGIVGDTYGSELVIDGGVRFLRQNAAGAASVRIGGCCGGVYLRRMDSSLAETGLLIDTTLVSGGVTATKRNREVFVEGANFDSCTKWGIWQVAESVALLIMEKPWSASNGTSDTTNGTMGGVLIEGGATVVPVVTIDSPILYNNQGSGLVTQGGALVSLDGGQIFQNGQATNGAHGVDFGATMPTRFSINGTDINQNGKAAKGYGINIPAALNNFNITGASVYSNAQGSINNAAGFGPTKLIRDCLGFVTESSSVATVANGTSTLVVAHGLSATPATVHLTPVGAPSVGTYSAGAFDATNFTIDNGAVAAGARQFSWRASVTGN